jgi:hypothetical protein
VAGKTITFYVNSTKENTNDTTEGASGLYYSTARFSTDFGNKTTNDLTEGTSQFYYTEARFNTSLSAKTTNNLTEGTSSFYYNPATFLGTGGASISVSGKTITVYASSSGGINPSGGENELQKKTGLSFSPAELFVTRDGSVVTLGTTDGNNLVVRSDAFGYVELYSVNGDNSGKLTVDDGIVTLIHDTATSNGYFEADVNSSDVYHSDVVSVWSDGTLDLHSAGGSGYRFDSNSSFEGVLDFSQVTTADKLYTYPNYSGELALKGSFAGTGGASVSVSGPTITIYASSEGGGSTVYAGTGINITGGTITNTLGFVGTGGVSVSLSGNTYTFYGNSTKVNTNEVTEGASGLFYSVQRFSADFANKNTNDLTEGTSNFYFKPTYAVGTGGVSVSVAGMTITIYGNSTAVNSNNIVEGNSGLFYSSVRFDASLATKTTNDLAEGVSNFYYNPASFIGTGGASISVTGRTITVYATVGGGSTVYAGNGLAYEGLTLNNVLGFVGTGGASVSLTGNTYTIYAATAAASLMDWTEVTGASQGMAIDSGYIANNGSRVSLYIPTTAAQGSVVRVVGVGAGGWELSQGVSSIIYFGNVSTTAGVSGLIQSTNARDSVEMLCVIANLQWNVISSIGNLTVI